MFPNASLGIHQKGTNVVKSMFVPFLLKRLIIQFFIQMVQTVEVAAFILAGLVH